MINPADVLFAWDPSSGGGIMPTVGGEPNDDIRDGEKWLRVRSQGGGPLYQKRVKDQVPFSWVEKEGLLLPRWALFLENASTPANDESGAWGAGSIADGSWPGALTEVETVFADPPSDVVAGLYENDTGSFSQAVQSIGTFSGGREASSIIVEHAPGTPTTLGSDVFGIFDDTSTTWIIRLDQIDFAAGTAAVKDGTLLGVQKLADQGPNGGVVLRILMHGTGTAGNNRSFRLPRLTNGHAVIIHHGQHEERDYPTSPVVYAGAPASRPTDLPFYFARAPKPQEMVAYWRHVYRDSHGGFDDWWHFGEFTPGGGPFWQMDHGGGFEEYRSVHTNGSGNSTSTSVTISQIEPGDLVEVFAILQADGGSQIGVRRNGGSVSHGTTGAPTGGLDETAWTGDGRFILGDDTGQEHLRFLLARGASPDGYTSNANVADPDALMDELADVPIGPQQAGHAA